MAIYRTRPCKPDVFKMKYELVNMTDRQRIIMDSDYARQLKYNQGCLAE